MDPHTRKVHARELFQTRLESTGHPGTVLCFPLVTLELSRRFAGGEFALQQFLVLRRLALH